MMTESPNTNVLRQRDDLLKKLLAAISGDERQRKHLIFQGGGAMHFIYGSPRYSEDLDFVSIKLQYVPEIVMNDMQELSKRFLAEVNESIEDPKKFYSHKVIYKQSGLMRISYANGADQWPSVRIEVMPQYSQEPEEARGMWSPLLVETPREIYADKIVATLARIQKRGNIKGTDLFDLDFIVNNLGGPADNSMIEEKAASYKEQCWNEETRKKLLEYIQHPANVPKMTENIRKTLMPDVFHNRQFDREFFDKAASYFADLKINAPKQTVMPYSVNL
jgi:hypothetical protein